MKKKRSSLIWLIPIVSIAIILVLYLMLTLYYNDKFIVGTWINGKYCTGKSVEEVNALLLEDTELPSITITDLEGNVENIVVDEELCDLDYSLQLQTILRQQDNFSWFIRLLSGINQQISPDVTYDNEQLLGEIKKLNVIESVKNVELLKAKIVKTESGFILEHNLVPIPDEDKITSKILNDLETGELAIQLTEECYIDREPTSEIEHIFSLWEKVEDIQDCGIIYDMGDTKVPIDASVVAEWIVTDEDGIIQTDENNEIVLKEDCFKEFINSLADEYDTYNVPREFQTTRGDVVTIEKGTYGNRMNRKAEIAYLEEAFLSGVKETHTPTYTEEALYKGKDDIGDTYIEVDLTEQIMYYYEDGEIVVETPIVSGNIRSGHKTPVRICYVYNKQTDRILRGPGYASPVDYWMPVIGSIGIHDATWRNKFGGEIYKTNGSHGCINTPHDAMVTLYEKVEVGTPVIMFY